VWWAVVAAASGTHACLGSRAALLRRTAPRASTAHTPHTRAGSTSLTSPRRGRAFFPPRRLPSRSSYTPLFHLYHFALLLAQA